MSTNDTTPTTRVMCETCRNIITAIMFADGVTPKPHADAAGMFAWLEWHHPCVAFELMEIEHPKHVAPCDVDAHPMFQD